MTFWLFSFSQYAYLSGCSDVIGVGIGILLVLESEINVHSNVQIGSPGKISA